MAIQINRKLLNDAILSDPKVVSVLESVGERKVNTAVSNLLKKFENHPVTKEIEGGPNFSNISGTLGGYGNLFSFIGFNSGDSPTIIVKNLIKQIRFNAKPIRVPNIGATQARVFYGFDGPGLSRILEATPMPWIGGRSWLTGVERGISNLSHYINKKVRIRGSRSGEAVQIKYIYRPASFKTVPYFETMWNEFLQEIQQ